MVDKLYKEIATYYAAITNDRNFDRQIKCILDTFNADYSFKSLLELLAGQSFHSISVGRTSDVDVWAIDSSLDMKSLALENVFLRPDQYLVGVIRYALL